MDENLAPAPATNAEVTTAEIEQANPAPEAPASEPQQGSEQTDEQRASEAARTLNERAQRNRENAARRVAEDRDNYRRLAEMAIQALQQGQRPAQQPQQPAAPSAPKREDFQSYDDWIEAKATWTAERRADEILTRRMQEAAQQWQQTAEQQQRQAIDADHFARAAQFARAQPDFAEVTDREDIVIPPAASEAIKQMPDGPAILYTIGKHPEIADSLQRMPPQAQMVYLGQLSQFVRSNTSRISNAAPAGRTVGAKPSGGTALPDDTEAYMAAANKKFGRR